MKTALVLVAAIAALQLSHAQDETDCTAISVGLDTMPIDPITVPDLPICEAQRNVAQCCSTQYILDQLNITEQNFLEGLRIELRERFEVFEALADRLRAFLEGDFLSGFFSGLGNFGIGRGGRSGVINDLISNLRSRFDFMPGDDDTTSEESSRSRTNTTNGFNVRDFLGNALTGLENAAIRQLLAGRRVIDQNTTECIRQVIEGQIQEQRMEAQTEALQEIRRVMAAIENLRNFVRNLTDDLAGFRPLQQCINALVSLNTCGRCTAVRPPFCANVCGAIAQACYSPFNDALEDQLEQLWEVVRRILDAATDAIRNLNANRNVFDRAALVSQISAECGLDFSSRIGRQSDDDDDDDIPLLPNIISTAARTLRGGPFAYNGRRQRGPGLCRLLNTSRTNCWDGNQTRGTDIPEFDDDDIEDQIVNPVITIDQQTLVDQATSLGTPVTMALNSPAFSEVAPLALVLPGDGPSIVPGNGAAAMFITFTSLSLLLLVSIFVI